MRFIYLFLLLVYLGTSLQAQTTHFVNLAATGDNSGIDWLNAYTNLHTALENATAGDQIWVASGTYHASETNDRAVYFELKSAVKMYGSFEGTETSLDERDLQANQTIFDGDIGVLGDSTDNTFNLLYLPFPDSNTVVDGFVFTNALANDQTQQADQLRTSGSAVYINGSDATAYPKISKCIFENNTSITSGGAVFVTAGTTGSVAPRFVNCSFQRNKSINGEGGALYKKGSSNLDFENDFLNCQFESNYAFRSGGAMYLSESSKNDTFDMQNCIFNKNAAASFGGAMYISGRSNGTLINIDSVIFNNNQAKIGAGIYFTTSSIVKYITLNNCIFDGNNPFPLTGSTFAPDFLLNSDEIINQTGIVRISGCSFFTPNYLIANEILGSFKLIVEKCIFKNSTDLNVVTNNSIEIINNVFINNTLPLVLYGTNTGSEQVRILDNIFYSNNLRINAYPNALILGNAFINNYNNQLFGFQNIALLSNKVLNNIFYNNTGTTQASYQICNNANTTLSNNLFYDFPDCTSFPGLATCTSGNLFALDPMFVDTASGDFRLLPCSPAINAGLDSLYTQLGILTDFAGNPRILDGRSDIGALESLPLSAPIDPVVDPACNNTNNGSAAFNIIGGCEPYSFAWTTTTGASGTDTTAISAGTYHFTITDQQGKTYEQTLVIGETPAIQLSSDITKATCGTCPDGSIQVQPLSGAEPLQYLWSAGDTTMFIEDLLPGIYFLTVSDAWGCDQVFFYTVDFSIGIADLTTEQGCTVSPNPVSDVAVFRLKEGLFNGHRIRITDELGREVHTGTAHGGTYSWRPGGLPSGWYVWQVVNKDGKQMDSGRLLIR